MRNTKSMRLYVLIVFILTALLAGKAAVRAQDGAPHPMITPENAEQLTLFAMLGRGWINQIAWSPEGTILAMGSSAGVWLHDTTDFSAEPRFLETRADTWSVAFSVDGELLATGGRDMSVRVWEVEAVMRDPASVEPLYDLHCNVGSSWNHILDLAFDPTGAVLACASDGVMFWDMAMGDVRAVLRGDSDTRGDTHMAFSPDGTILATTGARDAKQRGLVRQWDIQTAELVSSWALPGEYSAGYGVAYSPNGAQLAVIGNGATVYDATTGAPTFTLDTAGNISSLLFSPTDDILITVGDRFVVWDASTGARKATLVSDTMTFLHTYYVDEFSYCWEEGSNYPWQPCPTTNDILNAIISPDGHFIAVAHSTGQITLWDTASGAHVTTLRGYNFGGAERGGACSDTISLDHFAFHPDGTTLAAGASGYITSGGWVELWNIEQQTIETYLEGETSMNALAYNLDGSLLATSNGGRLSVWDTATNTVRFDQLARGSVEAVTFSPDGIRLAAALDHGPVQIWDMTTGDTVSTFEVDADYLISIAFSPDGTLLAVGDHDGLVHWWNTILGEHLGTRAAHIGSINDLAFSPVSHPEGMVLALAGGASGRGGGSVTLWVMGVDGSVRERARPFPLRDRAESVAFNPDGSLLVAGSTDGSVWLWDVATREFLMTLHGQPRAPFHEVTFNADGSLLATGGWDGTILLWDVPPQP